MTPKQGLAFVRRHGIVLQAARGPVPSLAAAIAGGPIRGSWWGHEKGHEIFRVAEAVSDSPDVLVCKLVGGKVTFVHRRLWPALARIASRIPKGRLDRTWNEHTSTGAHRSRRLPFPKWVPPDVMKEAATLRVPEAESVLGPLLRVLLALALALGATTARAGSLDVRLPGPAGTLAGTLTIPDRGRPPFPAVVTLTGSGAHLRDGNRTPEHPYRPFRDIAGALAGCGVATLRLDDRGTGGSTGDANAATAEDTAADARAALRFLRARPDIDPRRVGLVGHSYGGVIAPMVAAEDPAVAAVVLLGGPARTFRETMRYQHRYRIENDAAIPAADREAALAQAMRQQEANVAASPEAWRRSIQDRDPLATARRLRVPVLILQGLTDRAVEPGDAALLEAAIRNGGNRRVKRVLFPEVNHHFQRDPIGAREGYDRLPDQRLAPEVLSALCAWLPASLRR